MEWGGRNRRGNYWGSRFDEPGVITGSAGEGSYMKANAPLHVTAKRCDCSIIVLFSRDAQWSDPFSSS